jgi:PucR C-terminal helix-turn-helix domain
MGAESVNPTQIDADERLGAAYMAVATFLEPRLDGIVDAVGEVLREEIPAYRAEEGRWLHENVRTILALTLDQLREGHAPGTTEIAAMTTLARRWASEGRPLDPRAFQLGARWVTVTVAEHAGELGVDGLDSQTLLAMQGAAWDWATVCSSILADAQRDHEVALARRDATHHSEFLRELASGAITPERLVREADALDLDIHQPYFAVEAECEAATSPSMAEIHIRRSGASEHHRPLSVILGRRVLAVAPKIPAECDGVTIAVGPPAVLEHAHTSFAEAAEALATARAFGITGIVDLATLGPLPLVTEAQMLADRLDERHLRKLDARGRAGLELEETVRTLLDLDRDFDAAAAVLHVHRNTIRYRVRRFHEITGLDLGCTQDLVAAWWLLKRREAAAAALSR